MISSSCSRHWRPEETVLSAANRGVMKSKRPGCCGEREGEREGGRGGGGEGEREGGKKGERGEGGREGRRQVGGGREGE